MSSQERHHRARDELAAALVERAQQLHLLSCILLVLCSYTAYTKHTSHCLLTGFVWVLENLESHGI